MSRRRPVRKGWNGGSIEAAMAAASARTEAAIASGCQRCPTCHGVGMLAAQPVLCPTCDCAGFLIPPGGMPKPKETP